MLVRQPSTAQTPCMEPSDARQQYRQLPEPVRPEDTVETMDTSRPPEPDRDAERDWLLRNAG